MEGLRAVGTEATKKSERQSARSSRGSRSSVNGEFAGAAGAILTDYIDPLERLPAAGESGRHI